MNYGLKFRGYCVYKRRHSKVLKLLLPARNSYDMAPTNYRRSPKMAPVVEAYISIIATDLGQGWTIITSAQCNCMRPNQVRSQ